MSNLFRPGLFFTEMVKMDALIRNDFNTFRLLDYTFDMHPIGAQICGSKPKYAKQAAKIVEDLGFDVLDLNCGCPVDKVTKDGSGSGLLRNPLVIGEILSEMVNAVSIPVTVKIRVGWDSNEIVAPRVTKIAEDAGAKAITIHGRTRAQAYSGPANWDLIKECVDTREKILVVGNGDVFDPPSAKALFEKTNCDAVLVARGTMGKPYISEDIKMYLLEETPKHRDGVFLKSIFVEHFHFTKNYQREKRAVVDMRRVGCWYFKKMHETKGLREKLNKAKTLDDIDDLINTFPWHEIVHINSESSEIS